MAAFITRSFLICLQVLVGYACLYRFCHKGTKAQSFNSSLLLGLNAFQKGSKRLNFPFSLHGNKKFLLETAPLAPIVVEILLLFSLKSKRLQRIAGTAPLLKTEFQILKCFDYAQPDKIILIYFSPYIYG